MTGAVSDSDCQSCPIGTYTMSQGSTDSSACVPCPTGTHRLNDRPGCELCPPSTYTSTLDEAQQLECLDCAPLHYSDRYGASSCEICNSGEFSAAGWTKCVPCKGKTGHCPPSRNGVECSGNGVCEYGACQCFSNWTGPDCGQEVCLNGICTWTSTGVVFFNPFQTRYKYLENETNAVLSISREAGTSGAIHVLIESETESIRVDFQDKIQNVEIDFPIEDDLNMSNSCRVIDIRLVGSENGNVSVIPNDTILSIAIEDDDFQGQMLSSRDVLLSSASIGTTFTSEFTLDQPIDVVTQVVLVVNARDDSISQMLSGIVSSFESELQFVSMDLSIITTDQIQYVTSLENISFTESSEDLSLDILTQIFSNDSPIQWNESGRRLLVVLSHQGLALDHIEPFKQELVTHNIYPLFIPHDSVAFGFQSLVTELKFGSVSAFQDKFTIPWILQEAIVSEIKTQITLVNAFDPFGFIQEMNDTTITFRSAAATDPVKSEIDLLMLGFDHLNLTISTTQSQCNETTAASILPEKGFTGWIGPSEWKNLNTEWQLIEKQVETPWGIQDLVLDAQAVDPIEPFTATTEIKASISQGLPLIIRGFNRGGNLSFAFLSHDNVTLIETLAFTQDQWTYEWKRIVPVNEIDSILVTATCSESPCQWTGTGLFIDPQVACECEPGFYLRVREGIRYCHPCPAGFSCASGQKIKCPEKMFAFGGSSTCQFCYPG